MLRNKIDWPSFIACVAIIFLVCIPLAASPESGGAFLQSIYEFISQKFGVLYLLASVAAISFLIWLASSRFGAIKLGQPDDQPEFETISWIAMLFCAGIGAGLLYWCATENRYRER